jgi:hypothetical protein
LMFEVGFCCGLAEWVIVGLIFMWVLKKDGLIW